MLYDICDSLTENEKPAISLTDILPMKQDNTKEDFRAYFQKIVIKTRWEQKEQVKSYNSTLSSD